MKAMTAAKIPVALQGLSRPHTEQAAEELVFLQQRKQDKWNNGTSFPLVKAMVYVRDYPMPFYSPNHRP